MRISTIDREELAGVTGGFDFSPIFRAKDDQLKLAAQRQQAAQSLSMSPQSSASSGADGAQKKW